MAFRNCRQQLARRSSAWWQATLARCQASHSFSGIASSAGLSEQQLLFKQAADDFATTELSPYSAHWDENHIFPIDTLRKAARLGFGGMYIPDAHGGAGLQRADAAIVFESLSYGDVSVAAYLSIHNMVTAAIERSCLNRSLCWVQLINCFFSISVPALSSRRGGALATCNHLRWL